MLSRTGQAVGSLGSSRVASGLSAPVPFASLGHAQPSAARALPPAPTSSTMSYAQQPICRVQAPRRRVVLARGQANSSLSLPIDLDLEQPLPGFDSIESALADLADGKLVVVLDDEDRENEGDLIMNADKVTTETMAFLVEYTSGVVCISMEGQDLDRLRLPLMVSSAENEESMYTAFAITVDLREDITTGISASDRAKTIRHLANPAAVAGDFRRPGHIFPLRYRQGGVLVRPGHTEAALDLARLSGSFPAGVLCEVVNKEDGSMARTPELLAFAKQHNLKCITIADLIRYRLRHDQLVQETGQPTQLTTGSGIPVAAHCFRSTIDGTEHLALVHGHVSPTASNSNGSSYDGPEVLVHVHHERTVADLLDLSPPSSSSASSPANGNGNGNGSHAPQGSLDAALRSVQAAGSGVVLYIRGQSARHLGMAQELNALQGRSCELYGMDLKDAALAAQMLRSLGVTRVALAGADGQMATALRSCGLAVRQVAAAGAVSSSNGHAVSNGVQRPLTAAR